ncbi:S8 family peptidase [Streptomyces sp. NBC_01477]|uniref:S8 family peptidase n=1 Tax=Streptomyces sp. NBC_01477 TaxID=2976015 RepID=UPI002E347A31|nr:S8 family peptidase [Streptomyces sp. NBC_01477]
MRLSPRQTSAALLLAVVLVAAPAAYAVEPPAAAVAVERSARAVPGQYIVTLKPGRAPGGLLRALGITPRFTYTDALNGFAAVLDPLVLRAVRTDPAVEAVEENSVVSVPAPSGELPRPARRAVAATWGLDRIDQRTLPLDGRFTTRGHGAGATAYILDTGIDFAHEQFGGRAVPGFDAVGDGRNGLDCHGHGTHVAGTVAGRTYGVAPLARLVAVRVLDCTGNGDKAQTIAGLDWVARNAQRPAVLNASIGEERSTALNDAATALSDQGVLPVVSAGNDAADACTASPASADRVVTVAASDRQDEESGFSNWGPCVTLYAPGQAVESAKLGGGSITFSGTSMAAPHVAGTAALYAAEHPDATPAEVTAFLTRAATTGVLTGVHEGTPDRLLFTEGL